MEDNRAAMLESLSRIEVEVLTRRTCALILFEREGKKTFTAVM